MTAPHSDRNLLFGILAVQMDFISRDDLVTAMHAWVLDKSKSLGDILIAQQALPSKRRLLLDSLVEEHLEQHGQDVEKSLAAIGADVIARSRLAEVADADVQASLVRSIRSVGEHDGGPLVLSTVAYQATQTGSRFVPLRPHAKGGLGEVFVARDEELHREVALKEIQARFGQDAAGRARFVQEAEITGKLEHPGIVPVYGFGVYADGRPYYAMRLIRGESLKEAIQHFHRTTHASPGERILALRKLLGSFLAVCQALSYAHSRGIVHRDVKPDNIMLGKFGETLVVDWGLAKPLTQLQADGLPETSLAEGPLVPSSGSGSAQTIAGSALGTPAYMSPEQAAGRLDLIAQASDVYSLGATLYCVLTGHAPFAGKDVGEVLQQVQRGQYPRPREVDRQIPAALEAVCVKAMALERKDRYGTAQEMAADLEHWLADEPVRAYREPWTTRLARWSRRHRSVVAGSAALLVTAVVALSVGLYVVEGERDEKAKAHAQAEEQRKRAEANFRQARQAVDTYFTQVSEDQLLNEPGMQPLRQKLLKSALHYYQDFERQGSNDPSLRQDLAFAHLRLGIISKEIGIRKEANDALSNGIRAFEQLLQINPDDHEVQSGLAQCCVALASLQVFSGQLAEGEETCQHIVALLEKLTAKHPSSSEYPRLLGRTNDLIAVSRAKRGQLVAAEPFCQRAITVLSRAVHDFPADTEARRLLALAHSNHGTVHQISGQLTTTERAFEQAASQLQQLVQENPRSARCQAELARSLGNLGYLYCLLGKQTAANKSLHQAEGFLDKLRRENPSVMEYVDLQAFNYVRRGEVLVARGQTAAAIQALEKGFSIWEQQNLNGHESSQQLDSFGWASSVFTYAYCEAGQFVKAIAAYRKGIANEEAHLKLHPKNTNRHRKTLTLRELFVLLQLDSGQKTAKEQITAQIQIVQERDKLADNNPTNLQLKGELALGYIRLAVLQLRAGAAEAALTPLEQAFSLQQGLLQKQPGHFTHLKMQAQVHAMRGRALGLTGKPREALESARLAATIVEKLVKEDAAYAYDLACHRTLCSELVGGPGKNSAVVEIGKHKQYAEQAIAALQQAITAGYDNVYKLRNDPNLEPLRSRQDFQALLRQLEQKNQTPKE